MKEYAVNTIVKRKNPGPGSAGLDGFCLLSPEGLANVQYHLNDIKINENDLCTIIKNHILYKESPFTVLFHHKSAKFIACKTALSTVFFTDEL